MPGSSAASSSATSPSPLSIASPCHQAPAFQPVPELTTRNLKKRSAPSSPSPGRATKKRNTYTLIDDEPYSLPHSKAIYNIDQRFIWYKTTGPGPLESPPVPENIDLKTGDIFLHLDTTSNDPLPQAWQGVAGKWEPAVPFSTTRLIENECYVLSIHWVKKEPSWVLWNSVQKMNRFMVPVGRLDNNISGPSTSKSGRKPRSKSTKNSDSTKNKRRAH